MYSLTPKQAEELRCNTKTPRTDACPKCDVHNLVQPGISLHHACKCGNVWQPCQMFSRAPSAITLTDTGTLRDAT